MSIANLIKAYSRQSVRTPPTSIETRFPIAVRQFMSQIAAIRERHLRDPAGTRIAVIRSALHWGMYLLGATRAAHVVLERGAEPPQVNVHIGADEPRGSLALLKRLVTSIEAAERERRMPAAVWVRKSVVLGAYSLRYRYRGYLVFSEVKRVRPVHVALLESFMRVFEDAVRNFEQIDFALDQRRLLGRKTVVAQLRPNDLLYQALRRLQRYVGWGRNACILSPVPAGDTDAVAWQITAERLSGVAAVSGRIGGSFVLPRELSEASRRPLLIDDLTASAANNAWETEVMSIAQSASDLPRALPPARAAIIAPLPGTSGHAGLPYVVVLTDPATARFTAQDLEHTSAFFEDVGPLLTRSAAVSRSLMELWKQTETASANAYDADPDRVEALPEQMFSEGAPTLLAVDSLQVVQFRRGAIGRDDGPLMPLAFSAVQQPMVPTAQAARPSVTLRRGLNRTKQITAKATALWPSLTAGEESAVKNARGLAAGQFAGVFERARGGAAYGSAYVLPIHAEGEIAGALIAYRWKPSEFIEIDKMFLRTLAVRLGERIEFRRHIADHARLAVTVARIASAATESAAQQELVKGAKALLGADEAFLMVEQDPGDDETRVIADVAHTWQSPRISVPRLTVSGEPEGITGHVFASGHTFAVDDVTTCPFFKPLTTSDGTEIPISSEMAVPVTSPLADSTREKSVFGVIDVFWHGLHAITARERETIEVLSRHAGAVLHLARSLREAEQSRRSMEVLLTSAKELELADTEEQVLRWLVPHALGLFKANMLIVWSERMPGGPIELRAAFGDKARVAEVRGAMKTPGTERGWIGTVIEQYRKNNQSLAVDHFDTPSTQRVQVEGTTEEKYQSGLAFCVRPYRRSLTSVERDSVWAIAVYRFNPHRFDQRDRLRLPLIGKNAEAALQRIAYLRDERRSADLVAVTERLYRALTEGGEESGDVISQILEIVGTELRAQSVSLLRYRETGDVPTRDIWPDRLASTPRDPARAEGLSESVRRRGDLIVFDRDAPPPDLAHAVDASPFLPKFPKIKTIAALPLFDGRENRQFVGVLYINFERTSPCSDVELSFIRQVGAILVQYVRVGPTLSRMRNEMLERLQEIKDPRSVYHEVLELALHQIEKQIRERHPERRDLKVYGNLYMINRDRRSGAILRQRASKGEVSGEFPAVQRVSEGIIGEVARRGKWAIITDTHTSPNYLSYFRTMRSELAVPIVFREPQSDQPEGVAPNVIGVLNLECSEENVFEDRHIKLLEGYLKVPISSLLRLAESHQLLLQEKQDRLDEMVKDASVLIMHNMAKPIRNILTSVTTARRHLEQDDAESIDRNLETIAAEAQRFAEIAKTGFPYLTSEMRQMRKTDVVATISEWVAVARETPVEFTVPRDVPEFFIERGHPVLIITVLTNLYSNSLSALERRGDRQGRIWIECRPGDETPGRRSLVVEFNDNGPGLGRDTSKWDELFHILKEKKEDGKGVGWGIGLPLSRRLMELMDGDLELVSSTPLERTTFQLRFTGATD